MNEKEWIIIYLLLANTGISLLYLLWGTLLRPIWKKEEGKRERRKYFLIFWILLFCPLVGLLFLGFGNLFFGVFFRQQVDLSDVIFSKSKVKTNERVDMESGLNIAPLEEAIAISDKPSLRGLMMNVIKGDVKKSLAAIALALDSEDSETSHYAASVLMDELNTFRDNVEKIYKEIKKEEETQIQYCVMLLDYMNEILEQKVFIPMEQAYFVSKMEETAHIVYEKNLEELTGERMEWICLRLLEIGSYETCEMWCDRLKSSYPKELAAYTCLLKLYFTTERREDFFRIMQELKTSSIVIDNETLELIRIFS